MNLLDPNQPMPIVEVLGTPLRVATYAGLSDFCHRAIRKPGVFAIDFTNTQIVAMRRTEKAFRKMTEGVDYFIPDGMPLVWCMNRGGARMSDRVYGPAFMRECLRKTRAGYRHYFLGGSQKCLLKLFEQLQKRNPELEIVGFHNGYFDEDQEAEIIAEINRLSPDFIWIGLGTPKQQAWISRCKNRIRRGALLAVGYAFDVNAGTKADPPIWMQRRGLGWVFRLASEPKRLARRYFKYNTIFLFFLLWDSFCGRAIRSRSPSLCQ